MESPPDHRPRLSVSEGGGEGTGLPWWSRKSRLPTQGTRVRSVVQEEPVRHGATERLRHNYGSRRALAHAHRDEARRPTAAAREGRAQQ